MLKTLVQTIKETNVEVKWWSYAAWTLPFAALALIAFVHYIGWTDVMHKLMIVITTVFFSISVYWWWWALNKFLAVLKAMKDNEDRFAEVIYEIKETRKVLKDTVTSSTARKQ